MLPCADPEFEAGASAQSRTYGAVAAVAITIMANNPTKSPKPLDKNSTYLCEILYK